MNAATESEFFTFKSFLRHLFPGCLIGLAIGAVIFAVVSPSEYPQILVRTTLLGIGSGLLVWFRKIATEEAASHTPRSTMCDGGTSEHSPRPFFQRLAQYTGFDEEDFRRPRPKPTSRMTFWSIREFETWHGPKTALVIRRILQRIREAVHGPSHGC